MASPLASSVGPAPTTGEDDARYEDRQRVLQTFATLLGTSQVQQSHPPHQRGGFNNNNAAHPSVSNVMGGVGLSGGTSPPNAGLLAGAMGMGLGMGHHRHGVGGSSPNLTADHPTTTSTTTSSGRQALQVHSQELSKWLVRDDPSALCVLPSLDLFSGDVPDIATLAAGNESVGRMNALKSTTATRRSSDPGLERDRDDHRSSPPSHVRAASTVSAEAPAATMTAASEDAKRSSPPPGILRNESSVQQPSDSARRRLSWEASSTIMPRTESLGMSRMTLGSNVRIPAMAASVFDSVPVGPPPSERLSAQQQLVCPKSESSVATSTAAAAAVGDDVTVGSMDTANKKGDATMEVDGNGSGNNNSSYQDVEGQAARNLSEPISWTRSSVPQAPLTALRSLSASLSSLIDSRMRAWTLVLLRHSLNAGDEKSRGRLLTLLATSSSIGLAGAVTTFQTLEMSPLGSGRDGKDPHKLILPLIFEAAIDLTIQNQVTTVRLKAPGTIVGNFASTGNLMRHVEVTLETKSLIQSMIEQARLVLFKVVATANASGGTRPSQRMEAIVEMSKASSSAASSSTGYSPSSNRLSPQGQDGQKLRSSSVKFPCDEGQDNDEHKNSRRRDSIAEEDDEFVTHKPAGMLLGGDGDGCDGPAQVSPHSSPLQSFASMNLLSRNLSRRKVHNHQGGDDVFSLGKKTRSVTWKIEESSAAMRTGAAASSVSDQHPTSSSSSSSSPGGGSDGNGGPSSATTSGGAMASDSHEAKKRKVYPLASCKLRSSKSFGKPDASFFECKRNSTFAEFGHVEKNSHISSRMQSGSNSAHHQGLTPTGGRQGGMDQGGSRGQPGGDGRSFGLHRSTASMHHMSGGGGLSRGNASFANVRPSAAGTRSSFGLSRGGGDSCASMGPPPGLSRNMVFSSFTAAHGKEALAAATTAMSSQAGGGGASKSSLSTSSVSTFSGAATGGGGAHQPQGGHGGLAVDEFMKLAYRRSSK